MEVRIPIFKLKDKPLIEEVTHVWVVVTWLILQPQENAQLAEFHQHF